MTLEQAIAYIQDDELVEVTPKVIRIRKRYLDPHERKRQSRKAEAALPQPLSRGSIALLQPADIPEGMTEDEIAACHEAAHAAFATFSKWTKLAGPVSLDGGGCGEIVMSTDGAAAGRAIQADPGFDRQIPRIYLIGSLLAGPMAERILLERGRARLTESDLVAIGERDYRNISEQLGHIDPPRPGLLEGLERDVRRWLERPPVWAAVEQFAAILRDRRRLEAEEASAVLNDIGAALGILAKPAKKRSWLPFAAAFFVIAAAAIGAIWLTSA
jgi:hypothetical protein